MTKPTTYKGPASTAAAQFDVAAHWLKEAAMCAKDEYLRGNLERVRRDCLTMASRVGNKEEDGA